MYTVKLQFSGLGIWLYPRFMFGDNIMGTTRAITFCVDSNAKVKIQTKWNQSFIIKFTDGKFVSGDYVGTIRFNNIGSFPIKIDWKIEESGNLLPVPPYYIRQSILGF